MTIMFKLDLEDRLSIKGRSKGSLKLNDSIISVSLNPNEDNQKNEIKFRYKDDVYKNEKERIENYLEEKNVLKKVDIGGYRNKPSGSQICIVGDIDIKIADKRY